MKVRVLAALTALTALALAGGAPPITLDSLGSDPPRVDISTYVQHINLLTS
ncbi:hypothetical protein HCN51_38810 [Nonomuraea sp. FMUSA5-5]|uniref:Uncharacterized protein n=1 Tax=Nonomuraea composti TaxID=2720023 RepID=A0ABX1BFT4_9ACTN|nr:hypothetical protein [Nonomuraea sp. FMUSA5-5]NJP95324.1 hypothetical protein [Nonomuraea sp. FMUSA5-5]